MSSSVAFGSKPRRAGERLPGLVVHVIARQALRRRELRRQESARWSRRREGLQLPIAGDALAILLAVDQLAQRHAHRHFVDAGSFHIAGDGEKMRRPCQPFTPCAA